MIYGCLQENGKLRNDRDHFYLLLVSTSKKKKLTGSGVEIDQRTRRKNEGSRCETLKFRPPGFVRRQ